MEKIIQQSYIKANLAISILYFFGAFISLQLSQNFFYSIPIWIPFGLSAGVIYFFGISILPGFVVSSFISHYILVSILAKNSSIEFSFSSILITVLAETIMLLLFHWYKERRNWISITMRRELEVIRFFGISLLLPIPLVVSQILIFQHIDSTIWQNKVLWFSLYIGYSSSLVLFSPLVVSWIRNTSQQDIKTIPKKYLLTFLVYTLILLTLNFYVPITGIDSTKIFFIGSFPIFIFLSQKYSQRIFTSSLVIFTLLLLIYPAYQELSINEAVQHNSEILSFIIIVSISSLFLKEQAAAVTRAKDTLKEEYKSIEEEINRQVIEYKIINNNLLVEIEKRGIAERELRRNRELLSEAQSVGRISTWEYSIPEKRFRWLSHSQTPLYNDYDINSLSLKGVVSLIHKDDLRLIYKKKKEILRDGQDFETEIRIMNPEGKWNYLLIRGKHIKDADNNARILGLIMDISHRKQAELELSEKEQKYRALFLSNIDPICLIDAKSTEIQDVNPAFESVYGYKLHEIKGKSYILLSAQPEETKSAIASAYQKGFYRVSHRIHRKKSGESFFLEGSLMKYQMSGKDMLIIISHDITQRKEAEIKLSEREQKFRAFFESDLIGMAEISIAKQWISFNEKLASILRYSPKELMNKTWDEITHPDDLLVESKLFNQLLTHEKTNYTIEKRFITKNSSYIYCKVTVKALKTVTSNISHLIMLVDDISNQKRFETQLQESKLHLAQAQTIAKLGSIRFQPEKNLVILSDEAYEILGYEGKRPPISRRDIFNAFIPSALNRFEQQICDLENGFDVKGSYEQALVSSSGEVRYLLTHFGSSRNSQNRTTEVVVTLADITRIKQAEIALKEANAFKDQVFTIIGHDLRSPIGAIKQLIELYAEGHDEMDKESSATILDTLKTTSEETYHLLESLLDWAKSQRQETYKPVSANLSRLIYEVVVLVKGLSKSKNLTIQTNLPEKAMVVIDIDMIMAVLRNLIGNSIKFTPETGVISVSVEEQPNLYEVTIADTGKGITPEVLPKLFDNTSTYSTLGTNNEKGTGLGLKLVKRFVERNGGTINVESIEGQGSTFRFTIPKYNEATE